MSEKSKAGRPEFQPTDKQRRRVTICAGSGRMSHEEIALALGIARNTLEKHFEWELSFGAYLRRAEVLESMHAAAGKGNVTAQRAYLECDPALAAPPAEVDAVAEKPQKRGKKEQATVDAAVAQKGTEWDGLLPSGVAH